MQKDGAFLILFRNDQKKEVFLVFRSDYPLWVLTGGGVELGEKPKEAAIREAREETGFKVKLVRKIGRYDLVSQKKRILRKTYLYEGRIISGEFKPEFPGCKGQWFSINHLPPDLTSTTKQMINNAFLFNGRPYVKKAFTEFKSSDIKLVFRHPFAALRFSIDRLGKLI